MVRFWFWKALGSSIVANVVTRMRYRLRDAAGSSPGRMSFEPNRRGNMFAGLGYDLRFAVRAVAKNPGLTAGAVIMLALGMGVNTAMFGMHAGISGVIERLEEPDELVFLWGVTRGSDSTRVSAQDFLAWRAQADAFQEMGIYRQVTRYVLGDGEPQRISVVQASANLLPMLGLDAEVGRLPVPGEATGSASPVAVIAYRFWQERYAGDTDVLGRTIHLNDVPITIIGVLPAEAEFEVLWRDAAVFVPLTLGPSELTWDDRSYRVIARLADGSSVEQAQAQVTAIAARLAEAQQATNSDVGARAEPFANRFYSPQDKLAVGSLLAAVFAVLLIACVNLANVLLAKGSARQGEVAIRLALGASRGRVVRQLLTESLLLSLLGGALGVVLGLWALQLLLASFPTMPFLPQEVGLDLVVLSHAFAVAVAAALAFGLTPALLASRAPLNESIKAGSGRSASPSRKRFRSGLLVTQLALTVPLVLSCIVGFRQVQTLGNLDFGFPVDRLIVAQVDLPAYRFTENSQRTEFYDAAVQAVGNLPGVTAAAAGMNVPIGAGQGGIRGPLVVEGRETEEGSNRGPRGYEVVTPEYFRTLGAPLQRGRFMTPADGPGDSIVAVVNESMVRRYWPGQDPVGKRLIPDMAAGGWDSEDAPHDITVVGVVSDFGATFYGDPPNPAVYLSYRQRPTDSMKLVARTDLDPLSLAPALRAAVNGVDPGVPISQVQSGEGLVDVWLQESRTVAAMLGILGILALDMAVVGLYGMVAYSVAQRTFELGLRMVLGADRGAIRRTVMRSYVSLAAAGLVMGLFISAVGALVVRSQLVMLRIPLVSTVVGLVVLLVGAVLMASYLPARRATSIEPVQALRCE